MSVHGSYPRQPPLTLPAFERLREEDEYVLELDRGRLVREPRPGAQHGWLQVRLASRLRNHVERNRLGLVVVEAGVVLSEDPATVRGPDVSFTHIDRLGSDVPPEGFLRAPPDLAIEVISPSESADQIYQKVVQYLEAGVKLVWVVHPRSRTVTEYRSADVIRLLHEHDELHAKDLLPGFGFPLRELFAPLR
jgi:Uma2 family endonuclease